MIQGIFMSNQGIVGDRVGDFSSAILQIDPTGTALMLALSSGMGKTTAQDTIFNWFEDSHQAGRSATASGGTTTTVVVADGSQYIPSQVLLVEETGEVLYVTATSGNSLTVIRGIGGTSVVAIDNTMHVQSIGNAHEEAAGMPTAVTQQGANRMNYVQIFRNTWAVSGTTKAIKYRTGSKVAKNKRDCALYHAEDMERSFIFGRKHLTTLNGNPFRMSDGIVAQIQQYGGDVRAANSGGAGQLNWDDYEAWLMSLFSKNVKGQPNERLAIGGNQVIAVMNKMARLDGEYQIKQGENKLGIAVTKFTSAFGELSVMTHPLFNENPLWSKMLLALHPGAIRKRVLRETEDEGYDASGRRIDGIDADQGVMTTEVGWEVGAASTMGMLTNVTTGVASEAP